MAPGVRNRIKCEVGRGSNPSRPRWKPAYARKLAFDCTADSKSWRQVSSQLRQYYERSPNLGVFFPFGPPASRRSPPPVAAPLSPLPPSLGPLRRRRLSRKARARRSRRSSRAALAGAFDLFSVITQSVPYGACPDKVPVAVCRTASAAASRQFQTAPNGGPGPHSSGVEHSLGKGEVESSNLSVGTTYPLKTAKNERSSGTPKDTKTVNTP